MTLFPLLCSCGREVPSDHVRPVNQGGEASPPQPSVFAPKSASIPHVDLTTALLSQGWWSTLRNVSTHALFWAWVINSGTMHTC